MFSGIVQGTAEVIETRRESGLFTLKVQFPGVSLDGLVIGASVSLEGVCLTVVALDEDVCTFDVIQETLDRSTLGCLEIGSVVNFERSLRVGDEVGGHFVSGHIDVVGDVVAIDRFENNTIVWLSVPSAWCRYIFPKGYVALHGCSLTVAKVEKESSRFAVALIPETLRVTNLSSVKVSSKLNIEIDRATQAIVDTVDSRLVELGVLKVIT